MAAVLYFECPDCGVTINDQQNQFPLTANLICPHCRVEFQKSQGLNKRATPNFEEKRGFWGLLFQGSTREKSNKEQFDDAIRYWRSMIASALLRNDLRAAELYQGQLDRITDQYRW